MYVYREVIYEEEYKVLIFLSLIISYAVVLYLMVMTLPRYTVATSLGHMTRSKFLFQLLAEFHLHESKTAAHERAYLNTEATTNGVISKSPSEDKFESLHKFEVSAIQLYIFVNGSYNFYFEVHESG